MAGSSGDQSCRYAAGPLGMVTITLSDGHGREKFEKAKARIQNPQPVSGLGDQAVLWTASQQNCALLILKGDRSIAITVTGPNSARQALTELARKTLSRI